MVETDQFRYELNSYDEPLKELRSALDLDNKAKKIEELEMHMEDQGFWNDPETSQKKLKELKALKDAFTNYNELEKLRDDEKGIYDYRSDVHDIYHGICSKDHPSVNRQDRPRDAGFS